MNTKERPILFSAPMVRAILDGKKTQTRRLIKCPPPPEFTGKPTPMDYEEPVYWDFDSHHIFPKYYVGDRLWVKETLKRYNREPATAQYAADLTAVTVLPNRDAAGRSLWCWKNKSLPSIHCPRLASRITLEITGTGAERLNDISEADAIAEGTREPSLVPIVGACTTERDVYAKLWEKINGSGSWAANPWVWVVQFKRV